MEAVLDGETRRVTRPKRKAGASTVIVWCPFCERSSQAQLLIAPCGGCGASFRDTVPEAVPAAGVEEATEETDEPTAPRRRSRASE